MRKILLFSVISFLLSMSLVEAGWFRRGWWGVNNIPDVDCWNNRNTKDFWIHQVNPQGPFVRGHGTHGDEGAGIAMIARDSLVVESDGGNYGALFCPTQIQGANRNKNYHTWVTYYSPVTGGAGSLCVWLCAPGRTGAWCRNKATQADTCEGKKITLTPQWLRNNFSIRTSGGDSGSVEDTRWMILREEHAMGCGRPTGWWQGGNKNKGEVEIVYGVTEFLANGKGVIAEPVAVYAPLYGYKNNDSNIVATAGFGSRSVLCLDGYAGPNCSETSLMCQVDSVCDGYDLRKLVPGTHILGVDKDKKCGLVKCADPEKCMNADYSCVGYEKGFSGPHPDTGRCLICSGETPLFDAVRGCIAADLKQKPRIKNCFLTASLDEFRDCLLEGKQSATFFPPKPETE
jgi:hypothetical protein